MNSEISSLCQVMTYLTLANWRLRELAGRRRREHRSRTAHSRVSMNSEISSLCRVRAYLTLANWRLGELSGRRLREHRSRTAHSRISMNSEISSLCQVMTYLTLANLAPEGALGKRCVPKCRQIDTFLVGAPFMILICEHLALTGAIGREISGTRFQAPVSGPVCRASCVYRIHRARDFRGTAKQKG